MQLFESGNFTKLFTINCYSTNSKLEEELDILLFERINKTVRLTNAGQEF